jgi:Skp family chaperone for outer membrane proteins
VFRLNGGPLKIERVLDELRKERKKIDAAIAALQPLVRERRQGKRSRETRQVNQLLQAEAAQRTTEPRSAIKEQKSSSSLRQPAERMLTGYRVELDVCHAWIDEQLLWNFSP